MPKGELIPKILEILQVQTESTANLIDIAFSAGPGEVYRKTRRFMKYGPKRLKTDWASEYRQQQNFYSILNKLKNQGLIEKKADKSKKGTIWEITKRGLEKLKLIKKGAGFRKKIVDYKKESDDKLKIVIFDIPEKERHKRAWLRAVLVSLNFSMIQQSVWMGRNKIPEQFLYDLKKYDMLSYVQIFEISKKGTIN